MQDEGIDDIEDTLFLQASELISGLRRNLSPEVTW